MANKKISELTALGAAPAGDDVVPVVDSSTSTTKKVSVTNLLSSKADSSHTHAITDVTNLQTSLDAKQATVTAGDGLSFSGDTLNAEVTQAELDAKQDIVTAGDGLSFNGSTLNAEVTQAELDAKAASSHTHTLSDITDSGTAAPLNVASSGDAASGEVVKGDDSRLTDARTPSSHTHAISEVTNLQTSLDAKAASSHTHTASEITDFDTEVANNSAVTANTAKVTNATHTGDATGSTALTVERIQGRSVSSTAPSDGQVLKWDDNNSEWKPMPDNNSGGGGGSASAAGSTGYLQFNDGSNNFDASSNLVWDDTNNRLGVGGSPTQALHVQDGSVLIEGDGQDLLIDSADENLFLIGNRSGGEPDKAYLRMKSGGTNTIVLDTGGDTFFNGGNVGIGTTSPSSSAKLHVAGKLLLDDSGDGYVYLGSDYHQYIKGDSGSNWMAFFTANTERLRIDSSGNVKVGNGSTITASTDADDLVIDKGAADTGLSILSTTTGRIYFGDAANNDAGSIRYVHSDDSMRFETDDTERLRIDSSGRVGIGTASPSSYYSRASDLVVARDDHAGITIKTGTSDTGWLAFADGTAGGDNTRGAVSYDHSDNSMKFRVNNDSKVAIDSSGNLAVGHTQPSFNTGGGLHIKDTSRANLKIETGSSACEQFVDGNDFYLDHYPTGSIVFRNNTRTERMLTWSGATPYRTSPNGTGNLSKTSTSRPCCSRASAAYIPEGPDPTTATFDVTHPP